MTQGTNWKLFQFEQQIPLTGGTFKVQLNSTDLLQGIYNAANAAAANPSIITSLNSYSVGIGTNEGSQLSIAAGFEPSSAVTSTFVNVGVVIQGCNSQSSTLQAFTDQLSIPPASTVGRTLASTTTSRCIRTCEASLLPISLTPKINFDILGNPFGKNGLVNAVGDSLVLAGIALAVGTVTYYLKEQ